MTKVCFFFFRVSRKLSPVRCRTLVCCSSQVGSGGGGASGLQGAGVEGTQSSGEAHEQANASSPPPRPPPHSQHAGEHESNPFACFLKFNLKPLFKHEKICTINKDS